MIIVNARFLTQNVSGIQRFAIDLSRELAKSGINCKFVAPANIISEHAARELNVIKYGKLKGHFWEQIELPGFLKKNGDPLLINLANTAPLKYSKMVTLIADLSFTERDNWFSWRFKTFYNYLIPRVAKQSLKIITMSNFTKNELIRKYNLPPEKIIIVNGAISNELANSRSSYDDAQSIDKCGKYILSVSSLDPRKNLSALIDSYLKSNCEFIKLRIVGSYNKIFSDPKISKKIRGNKNIILEGYVSDSKLAILYQKALFFIYPSLYEGFGLPPLEAMYFGCPTIVSDIPTLKEVCNDASLYVNPKSGEDITKQISLLAGNKALREKLRSKGYERARCFTLDTSVTKVVDLINSLDVIG